MCNIREQVLKFEDERAVGKFRDVNTWVFNNTQYTEMAKNKFWIIVVHIFIYLLMLHLVQMIGQ